MSAPSLGERVMRSSAVSIAASVVRQSIGIVSMLVLARLLTPQDYGIVAASMLLVGLFDVLSQTGINQYVLARPELDDEELCTAWTLRLLIRVGIAVVLACASPLLARFFGDARLVPVLCATCLLPVVDALQGPGLLLMRREFEYRAIAIVTVLAKLAGFAVALALAWLHQTYWALVLGSLAATLTHTLASYRMHPFRPWFTLVGVREQWSFSSWSLARAVLGHCRAKADDFAIGRYLGVTGLGVYTMSKTLATMAHTHLAEPVADIITSSIGGTSDRAEAAGGSLVKILCVLVSTVLPVAAGLHLCADVVVAALLGPSWTAAVPVIEALAPLTLTFSVSAVIGTALVAVGRIRTAFTLDALTTALIFGAVIAAVLAEADVAAFAWARTGAGYAVAALFYACVSRVVRLDHRALLVSLLPCAAATLLMGAAVGLVREALDGAGPIASLAAFGLVGGTVYGASFLALLHAGPLDTPELRFVRELSGRTLGSVRAKLAGGGAGGEARRGGAGDAEASGKSV